jgi:hypothetical protein
LLESLFHFDLIETGKHIQMLARQFRAVLVPTVFKGPAGADDRRDLTLAGDVLLGRITAIQWLLFAVLSLASSRAEAACVDPKTSSHVTVSITRYFDEEERKSEPDLLGIRGTGWLVSPRSMVTVEHVAEAMHLSSHQWKDIEIRDGENKRSVAVRLLRLAGTQSEKIAILELKTPLPQAQFLRFRMEPLVANERVTSLAYADADDQLRVVDGRFVEYGADDKFTGAALFELYDGNNRLVLDHGASGTPVIDCQGRVVAVVSNILTQTIQFFSTIRVSTAWGYPNVVSVPIQVLKSFSIAE